MRVSIKDLCKTYPNGTKALTDINLEIESGMYGLLGPNGAGKTTLMRILVTLMQPDCGNVKINDLDLQKDRHQVRSLVGYLPQDFSLFSKLTTFEFLDYSASLSGLTRRKRHDAVEEWLEKVGLWEVRTRQANKLSGGMKRRLGIAQALVGNPQIVVVDEPTTGLDPEERIRFRNILADLSRRDIIILLSTHIVGDISSTCTDMALLLDGKVAFQGSPHGLIKNAEGHVWKVNALDHEMEKLKNEHLVISTIPSEAGYEVELVAQEITGFTAEKIEPNLEHAYVYFVEQQAGAHQNKSLNVNAIN